MRWPLRYQILVPFACVMLAVVIVVTLLDAALSASRSQRQIERQLEQVAITLQEATFPLTDAVLEQTRGLSGAEFLLTDDRGELAASTLAEAAEAARGLPRAAEAGSVELGEPVRIGRGDYLHTAVAIQPRGGDGRRQTLHILYPRDDLRLARWQAAYPSLVVGGLMLLVVVALAFAIAARMSRPILELQKQLSRLVQGDFRPLSVPPRNDELTDLIRSVNSLGDQLTELRRVIKRSERLALLGQLGGGLAHQLRNSVTGARIAVQLHRRSCRGIDDDSLEVALRQLVLTENHLQRFLAVGRPAAPRRAECRLASVIEEVVALVAPAFDHHRVTLDVAGTENDTALLADAEQLRQMLVNLVLNALEAAGSNGWVRIESELHRGNVRLRVIDSGTGPDPAIADRLFEPFVTGKPEGIGLGLSVVSQIVAAHGGAVRYRRDPHTCFEVELPAGLDKAADQLPAPDVAAASSGTR